MRASKSQNDRETKKQAASAYRLVSRQNEKTSNNKNK